MEAWLLLLLPFAVIFVLSLPALFDNPDNWRSRSTRPPGSAPGQRRKKGRR